MFIFDSHSKLLYSPTSDDELRDLSWTCASAPNYLRIAVQRRPAVTRVWETPLGHCSNYFSVFFPRRKGASWNGPWYQRQTTVADKARTTRRGFSCLTSGNDLVSREPQAHARSRSTTEGAPWPSYPVSDYSRPTEEPRPELVSDY